MKRENQNINLMTDFAFKRFFGTEPYKNNLIHFLNAVLPPHIGPVQDLTYLPTEQLGTSDTNKRLVFDVLCAKPDKRSHHRGDAEGEPGVLQGQGHRLLLAAHQRVVGSR